MTGMDSRGSRAPVALAAAGAALALAVAPASAMADYTASVAGAGVIFEGDAEGNDLVFELGLFAFAHNRFAAGDPGFDSAFDFDTTEPNSQPLPPGPGALVVVLGGGGDDAVFTDLAPGGGNRDLTIVDGEVTAAGLLQVRHGVDVESAEIATGAGSDEAVVLGTLEAGPEYRLNTANGADSISLGDGTLDAFEGFVRLSPGGDDGDRVILDDSGETQPHEYRLYEGASTTYFDRDGAAIGGIEASHSLSPGSLLLTGSRGDVIELERDLSGVGLLREVDAGGGDDRLIAVGDVTPIPGHAQAARLRGGAGTDTLDYREAPAELPVKVNLAAGTAPEVGAIAGWERVLGGAGPDRLSGDGGKDGFKSGSGNDRIKDTKGRNRIDCGPGRDRAVVSAKSKVKGNCERVRVR